MGAARSHETRGSRKIGSTCGDPCKWLRALGEAARTGGRPVSAWAAGLGDTSRIGGEADFSATPEKFSR